MKQTITQEQMDALTDLERLRLANWADPKDELNWPWSSDGVIRKGKLPLLTIGEMIWFLAEHTKSQGWMGIATPSERTGWRVQCKYAEFDEDETPELVDCLWNAVKMILREQEE